MTLSRGLAVVALLFAVAACDKDKEVDLPSELVEIQSTVPVQRVWSTSVGGGGEKLRLALALAEQDGTVFAAARNGRVRAIDATNGRTRWQTDTKLELSAGPGVGDGLVVIGTNGGRLVALDAASGQQRWTAQMTGEVLATPLVADGRVVVRSVDGRLRALSASDGAEAWAVEDQVPRLSLRGTSPPVRVADTVVGGFDSGRVMAVSLSSGETLWQAQLSTPRGRSELERLADVDAAVRVSGGDVYAVGYQGRIAMMALDTGQIWWARDISSYRGLDLDGDQIYVSTSEGDVVAMRRRDGSVIWQQEGLKRRGLGTPAVYAGTVVVGDFDGYLHWLDRDSGRFVARERPGNTRFATTPIVSGDRLFVIDDGGKVAAFRAGGGSGR